MKGRLGWWGTGCVVSGRLGWWVARGLVSGRLGWWVMVCVMSGRLWVDECLVSGRLWVAEWNGFMWRALQYGKPVHSWHQTCISIGCFLTLRMEQQRTHQLWLMPCPCSGPKHQFPPSLHAQNSNTWVYLWFMRLSLKKKVCPWQISWLIAREWPLKHKIKLKCALFKHPQ